MEKKKSAQLEKILTTREESLRSAQKNFEELAECLSAPLRVFANKEAQTFVTIFSKEEWSDDSAGNWRMQGVLPIGDDHRIQLGILSIWMDNDIEEGEKNGPIKVGLMRSREDILLERPCFEVLVPSDRETTLVCEIGCTGFEYRLRRFPSKEAALAYVEESGGLIDE